MTLAGISALGLALKGPKLPMFLGGEGESWIIFHITVLLYFIYVLLYFIYILLGPKSSYNPYIRGFLDPYLLYFSWESWLSISVFSRQPYSVWPSSVCNASVYRCMYVSVSDDNRFSVVQIQLCTVQAAKRTSVQFCTTDWAMRIWCCKMYNCTAAYNSSL